MIAWEYKICHEEGLYVRPISYIVSHLMKYDCRVQVESGGRKADGRDLMELLALGAGKGQMLKFSFEGREEKEAAEQLLRFLPEIGL